MKKSDFFYDLPEDLIAQYPLTVRHESRLLHLDGASGGIAHKQFSNLPDLLRENDLLVFNNTKVIPARLEARKPTGGRVEVMLDQIKGAKQATAQLGSSRTPRAGESLVFNNGAEILVKGRKEAVFELEITTCEHSWYDLCDAYGKMPLPPYIKRDDDEGDQTRYQTIYAEKPGSVAAPTAGLHFDHSVFEALDKKGVRRASVTLNIGAGTYLPVRTDDVKNHVMHSEYLEVDQKTCDLIAQTKQAGGRVIAVGTTAVRSLETATSHAKHGLIEPYKGETEIFIYPGYDFKVIDGLVTNFHLPESTLIMLVSALGGYSHVMAAYKEAVEEKYRFFSYGDSMFVTCNPDPDCPI